MDANEQISVLGIDLRVETRKAEKEIQGLLVVDIASGTPGAAAGLHPYRQPMRDLLNGMGMLAKMAFPPAVVGGAIRGDVRAGWPLVLQKRVARFRRDIARHIYQLV